MSKSESASADVNSEIETKLPLTVTKITVQKKNKDRYSLFHNKLFLIGISRKTMNDLSIEEGVNLTPSLFRQLKNAEDLVTIREACFRYLSRRDHSSFELKQKVGKKGYSKSYIEQVVQSLADKGYLNDESFASKICRRKDRTKSMGTKKKLDLSSIKKELTKKSSKTFSPKKLMICSNSRFV